MQCKVRARIAHVCEDRSMRSARAFIKRIEHPRRFLGMSLLCAALLGGVVFGALQLGGKSTPHAEKLPATRKIQPAAATVKKDLPAPQPKAAEIPLSSPVARIVIDGTIAHKTPNDEAKAIARLDAITPWAKTDQVLAVLEDRLVGDQRWLRLLLPQRPNGSSAWVKADEVQLQTSAWHLIVNRKSRNVRIYRAGKLVKQAPVVVGAPSTPTPRGEFAITDYIAQSNPSSNPYGTQVALLTAWSNVYERFAGGDGRVALHGRGGGLLKDPLGSAKSHGCVRFDNALISYIAKNVPVGSRVVIV